MSCSSAPSVFFRSELKNWLIAASRRSIFLVSVKTSTAATAVPVLAVTENIKKSKAGPSSMKVFRLICILLLSVASPLFAQSSSQQSSTPATAATGGTNSVITLDVVVANKGGKPQAGLQEQDFTLLDNKNPQKIISFHSIDEPGAPAVPPVEVVLVIDTVNAAPQTVANERLQIQKYLRQNGGKLSHPTSVVVFSDSGLKNIGEPSLDGNAVAASLDGNDVTPLHAMHQASGENGDFERLMSSVSKLYSLAGAEARKPGRKIVIWISPGWPLLASAGNQMYSKGKEQLFSTLVMVSNGLRLARITLYSIDPEGAGGSDFGRLQTKDQQFSRTSYESYLKGVSSEKQMMPPNLSLQVLATRSGGRVLLLGNDLSAQIDDCVSDTKAFYVLSFESARTEQPNDYHNLELKIDKPGLTARTSGGYYAQPEQRPTTSPGK
jgi:VWFA-related protein